MKVFVVVAVAVSLALLSVAANVLAEENGSQYTLQLVEKFFKTNEQQGEDDGHTQNWAVLVCTSKFWYNYRHTTNTLAVYRALKKFGMTDSNIILMLAEDTACNARNPFPSKLFATTTTSATGNSKARRRKRTVEEVESDKEVEEEDDGYDDDEDEVDEEERENIYGEDIEVDYRGAEVSVENFLRVLTGRYSSVKTPKSKRLLSDRRSNLLVYITGHGGEDFMKFQNMEEIVSKELSNAVEQLHQQQRYHRLLFLADTCQAASLFRHFHSIPNVITIGSSRTGESSYSYRNDYEIGAALIDRFTYFTMIYLDAHVPASLEVFDDGDDDRRGWQRSNHSSILALFKSYRPSVVYSSPEWMTSVKAVSREDDSTRAVDHSEQSSNRDMNSSLAEDDNSQLSTMPISDFFGSSVQVFLDA